MPNNPAQELASSAATRIDASSFPFWAEQGNLRDHWYPLAFESKLKINSATRQLALGIPVVIWKTNQGIKAFVDICPHRQAQLSQGTATADTLTCPYHGWQFDRDGKCNAIPIACADRMPRSSIELIALPTLSQAGIIWVWLGLEQPQSHHQSLTHGFDVQDSGWRFTTASRVFPFDLDDLIENFMDFAHTPVVHPGLIRGISNPQHRGVTIEVTTSAVKSIHDPVAEKVGWLSGLVVPRGEVRHSDTFLSPSNVLVEYAFGDRPPSFVAFLAMTPTQANETLLLLTIGTRFGWMNRFISLALPVLIRRVLAQDQHILSQQRANLNLISTRHRRSLHSDSVDSLVRALRAYHRDPSLPRPKPSTHRMHVQL